VFSVDVFIVLCMKLLLTRTVLNLSYTSEVCVSRKCRGEKTKKY